MKQNYSKLVSNEPTESNHIYTAYTLIDVTDSRVYEYELSDKIEYHQSQNLNVLLQLFSFRTQATIISVEMLINQDMRKYKFGKAFKGKNTIWKVSFSIDPDNIWENENDKFWFLKQDCDGVAITIGLTETASLNEEKIVLNDKQRLNMYFVY